MKAKHRRMKVRLIGKGKGPKVAPYNKNPSMARSKSAPPGFGAMGEAKERDPVLNGLAKRIIFAEDADEINQIKDYYFDMVEIEPKSMAEAIVDVFIEDVLLPKHRNIWHIGGNVASAFGAPYGNYSIQDHLQKLYEDWDSLSRMTSADPEEDPEQQMEDFKDIKSQSYDGAIHVI